MSLLLSLLLLAAPPADPIDHGAAYYHFSLAEQARSGGDLAQAVDEYRKAQKIDPRSGAIRAALARALRESGRMEEAITEARAGVSLAPDDDDVHLMLAQLYRYQAQASSSEEALKKAAEEYEQVVRLTPTDVESLLQLANVYVALDDHPAAARVLQKYVDLDPGNYEAFVELGKQLLALNEMEKGASALSKAIELKPQSPQLYQVLGDIYSRAEQFDQAILNYRKALELDPENVRLHLALGEVLFRAKRYKETLAEADAALRGDRQNRFALEMKGRALREERQYDEAMKAVDAALALDPTDLKSAYLRVTILEARRQFDEAAASLQKLLARDRRGEDPAESKNNDRVFLVHLGFADQQQQRYAQAAEDFQRAIDVAPDPDDSLFEHRLEALTLAKDYTRALSEARIAHLRFPKDPEIAMQEADVLRLSGNLEGGIKVAREVRQAFAGDVDAELAVAEFYQRARRFDEAEAILRGLLEKKPKDLRTLFQLGAVQERQKKHEAAEASFRAALEVSPDAAPILNYLGYMNADRGVNVEESLKMIQRAIALDPENGAYLDSLGWALYRLNRYDQAEQEVRRALARQGGAQSAVVLDHLGDILSRRGRTADAIAAWKQALAGEDDDKDLDRAGVEKKIRDGEASLEAHNHKQN